MKRTLTKGGPLNLDDIFADVKEVWSCHSFCTVCGEQFVEEIEMVNFSREMEPPVCPNCKVNNEFDKHVGREVRKIKTYG